MLCKYPARVGPALPPAFRVAAPVEHGSRTQQNRCSDPHMTPASKIQATAGRKPPVSPEPRPFGRRRFTCRARRPMDRLQETRPRPAAPKTAAMRHLFAGIEDRFSMTGSMSLITDDGVRGDDSKCARGRSIAAVADTEGVRRRAHKRRVKR